MAVNGIFESERYKENGENRNDDNRRAERIK